jgi:hypothetical protein
MAEKLKIKQFEQKPPIKKLFATCHTDDKNDKMNHLLTDIQKGKSVKRRNK